MLVLFCVVANCVSAAAEPRDLSYFEGLAKSINQATTDGKYEKALQLSNEFERAARDTFGEDTIEHAAGLNRKANFLQLLGEFNKAAPLFERVIEIYEKNLPKGHPDRATALNNLGVNRFWLKQYDEAVDLYHAALEVREQLTPPAPCAVAESLSNLAHVFMYLDRNEEALQLLERADQLSLDDICARLHKNILQNLASVFDNLGQPEKAEATLRNAIAVIEKIPGGNAIEMAGLINRVALQRFTVGDNKEASRQFKRAADIYRSLKKAPPSPFAATLQDSAINEIERGNYAKARRFLKEALQLREGAYGSLHSDIARTLSDLARLAHLDRKHQQALEYARRARVITDQLQTAIGPHTQLQCRNFVDVAWPNGKPNGPTYNHPLLSEAFEMAQCAIMREVAQTVEQTAARLSHDDPSVRQLLRAIEDLNSERERLELQLTERFSKAVFERNETDEKTVQEFKSIGRQLKELARKLQAAAPGLSQLVNPQPVALTAVQKVLQDNEALILILPTHNAVHTFAVTSSAASWKRQPFASKKFEKTVNELRVALDDSLLKPGEKPKTFDLELAHSLYRRLFGGLESSFASKPNLLVATSGVLDKLPLHVLVTRRHKNSGRKGRPDLRKAPWLLKRHSVTVLPSVGSLPAFRGREQRHADYAFLGFGNPLVEGDPETEQANAQLAKRWRKCRDIDANQVASLFQRRALVRLKFPTLAPANREMIMAQSPLPETALELCNVARSFQGDTAEVYLGERATENELRALSKRGDLLRYRVVHFATHALLAGELEHGSEPGLVLTPGNGPEPQNDGFLSRSEILTLKMNADWVVLSACNTAAPGSRGAEGLSGLAEAFFHAGARALLVSHWYIDSEAATDIVSTTFKELASAPHITRAEALRRSMLGYLETASEENVGPAYWAPFVVVGAGHGA